MSSQVEPGILTLMHFNSHPYNIVCIVSSLLGMLGAAYQVLPSPSIPVAQHRQNVIGHAQKEIINWLAMADFFAAFGILLRSIFWLWKPELIYEDGWGLIVCSMAAVWIRFFYTATFIFTLCYAVDVYLTCKQQKGNHKYYHAFTWSLSLLLTTVGLGTLYLPKFQCHSGMWRVLPNYLLSYIPIIVIMGINPILYYLSSKNVRILLTGGLGQLTYFEHNLLSALREKFFCIVLVFYVCWLPNVVNGIILWSCWNKIPRQILLAVWYMMAVINPLQAVLNSLVYKSWENCRPAWRNIRTLWNFQDRPRLGLIVEPTSSDQSSPEHQTFSTNNYQD